MGWYCILTPFIFNIYFLPSKSLHYSSKLLVACPNIFPVIMAVLYLDRACLVATIRSSGASQSTIKLVATNLIASGKLAGEAYCTVYLVLFSSLVH